MFKINKYKAMLIVITQGTQLFEKHLPVDVNVQWEYVNEKILDF